MWCLRPCLRSHLEAAIKQQGEVVGLLVSVLVTVYSHSQCEFFLFFCFCCWMEVGKQILYYCPVTYALIIVWQLDGFCVWLRAANCDSWGQYAILQCCALILNLHVPLQPSWTVSAFGVFSIFISFLCALSWLSTWLKSPKKGLTWLAATTDLTKDRNRTHRLTLSFFFFF